MTKPEGRRPFGITIRLVIGARTLSVLTCRLWRRLGLPCCLTAAGPRAAVLLAAVLTRPGEHWRGRDAQLILAGLGLSYLTCYVW
jgi:hypothetical protein